MGYNAVTNFKNFYMDVTRYLTNVLKNKGARALDAGVMGEMRYPNAQSYENEKLWLMQLTGPYNSSGI